MPDDHEKAPKKELSMRDWFGIIVGGTVGITTLLALKSIYGKKKPAINTTPAAAPPK